ncbi:OmpL47-type beta-barrel domain-containing protein [Polymorphospora rubra]|uniref:OmpL47-type beta-barrel domain-containing protein n=1 Tax=Polymorphospora rubra TaxID=338584 RepID=UPI001BB39C7D|nr:family 16 glycoside hydrolase [Polymorphospora rubra]
MPIPPTGAPGRRLRPPPRRTTASRFRRPLTALVAATAMLLSSTLASTPAGARPNGDDGPPQQRDAQVLTWTAGNDVSSYTTAPATASPGPATLVFENSAATGNTSGMQHTLTFETGDPTYNQDVNVNILADPFDANGGRWTVDVVLTPGTYRYFCAIPGHGLMNGLLIVSDDTGEDTTPPTVTAALSGQQNGSGAYIGAATVSLTATDSESGVDTVEYSLDGGAYTEYTAPVTVNETGQHTLSYRATDLAGNTSTPGSVSFTVVPPPDPDTTPPTVTAAVTGNRDDTGAYVGAATVTLTATDTESGVDTVEYSLDAGAYTSYTAPVTVNRPGQHTLTYRATDQAGNTSDAQSVSFTVVVGGGNPECPVLDTRPVVWLGTLNSGVPNRLVGTGCTINNLIASERLWLNHTEFMQHVRAVAKNLRELGVINNAERATLIETATASAVGKSDAQTGYRSILDRSGSSFDQWEHVGAGGFTRNADGSITSRPVAGLGMLWFPIRSYGDFSMKLQWRDDAPGDARANSGVFVRFPGVHQHPSEPRPEWVAIKYGHEIQVFDSPSGDRYKTGSVYGFDGVALDGAGVTPKGTWNDYEIRVVGQHYSIYRNGELINEFVNTPDAVFDPPRADDPGGAGRQRTHGYIGLQVHGANDIVSYRNVRVAPLTP